MLRPCVKLGLMAENEAKEAPPVEPAPAAAGAVVKARKALQGAKALRRAFGRLAGAPLAVLKLPLMLVRGEFATRLFVLGFLGGIGLMAYAGVALYRRFARETARPAGEKHEIAAEFDVFLKARQERLQAIENLVFLESFSAHLPAGTGLVRMLEVEIFIECDKPVTASWIQKHLTQSKDAVALVLQTKRYEELLSDEGKDKLKADIGASLDALMRKHALEGKIVRVYFSHLVMGT